MMGGFGMGGGAILWIILLGVVVWAIVNATTNRSGARPSAGSARETLDARLARGELTVDEYKKLRETLG